MYQRRPQSARTGFTLVEVLVAVLVLVCALTAFTRSLLGTVQLGRSNREAALATEGARGVIEAFYAADFEDVFALYNETAADDPIADTPGADFDVLGLAARDDDVDGRVGKVRFPTIDVGGVEVLCEDVNDAGLGMPRDLNGDDVVDADDRSGDYRILPVEVTVQWDGRSGLREVVLRTVVGSR